MAERKRPAAPVRRSTAQHDLLGELVQVGLGDTNASPGAGIGTRRAVAGLPSAAVGLGMPRRSATFEVPTPRPRRGHRAAAPRRPQGQRESRGPLCGRPVDLPVHLTASVSPGFTKVRTCDPSLVRRQFGVDQGLYLQRDSPTCPHEYASTAEVDADSRHT